MLMYSTHNFWLNIAFHFNQDEIAASHCENKAKPKLHCDGKCHLKKEIEKENNDKSPVNAKEKFEVLFFSEVKNWRTWVFAEKHSSAFIYKEVQYTEPSFSIIHPPA
jgi:hypothetical protein